MRWLARTAPLLLGSMLLACDGPTAPRSAVGSPDLSRAGNTNGACYPVTFQDLGAQGDDPWVATGELSGDLLGSFVVYFDPTSLKLLGKKGAPPRTVYIAGTVEWTITGGVMPGPYPLTFTGTFKQHNLLADTPVSPASVAEQVVTFHATSGVTTANLHFRGYFDADAGLAVHDWRGVICP